MAKKKRSAKSKAPASPKRSKEKPKTPKKRHSPSHKSIKVNRPKTPEGASVIKPKLLAGQKKDTSHLFEPKRQEQKKQIVKRDFEKTKTFKSFKKKYLQPKRIKTTKGKFVKYKSGNYKTTKADTKYIEQIKKFWHDQYNVKGQKAQDVVSQVQKIFLRNTRNRFYKTKIWYWGKTAWRKGKDGKMKGGKRVKRQVWRDKLTGEYIKGRKVGVRILRAMQPDLIRNFMQIKGIKDYNKAKKLYFKSIKNKSLGKIMELYKMS